MQDDGLPAERPLLELIAFAAWVNVPVDKIPPEMRAPTCAATMAAWKRVTDAIVAHVDADYVARLEALTAENERLRVLAKELADDLEVELQARWGFDERLAGKFKRDMEIVERTRTELEKRP